MIVPTTEELRAVIGTAMNESKHLDGTARACPNCAVAAVMVEDDRLLHTMRVCAIDAIAENNLTAMLAFSAAMFRAGMAFAESKTLESMLCDER